MSTEKRNENFMLKQSRYSKGKKNVKQYSKNNGLQLSFQRIIIYSADFNILNN